ncbi:MAG: NAD-dependent epimerase/dehydratase family protein [Promethearchaeati archaeon SRVP18_Atabeyarchaeia-1]
MKAKGIEHVLVTGGAGFIGSHTVDLLVEKGYAVTVIDSLEPQVHGPDAKPPDYLNPKARFIKEDILEARVLKTLLKESEAIIHLAAQVGVGQSMYQIDRYINSNTRGTSLLLDVLASGESSVRKLVVASSMSIYGEGKYWCEKCSCEVFPNIRTEDQLNRKKWEQVCPSCGSVVKPIPTSEDKPLAPASIYAMSKRHQEEMCLLIGSTYSLPSVALRYFNVYGPRQSLSNPYTGVCAIFSSRILNNAPPYIFEDGKQLRDFVHVRDVAKANVQAMELSSARGVPVNIGSGVSISILEIADMLIEMYDKKGSLRPVVSQEYRKGDTRHCYANIDRARKLLNFKPDVTFRDGLEELVEWGKSHGWGAVDLFEKSLNELKKRRLAK